MFAGSSTHFQLHIPTLTQRAQIDGVLDESVWQQAEQTTLSFETSPGENTQAPVMTDAKIYATDSSLFIAFIAQDPEPSRIRANLRGRDDSWGDDIVGIKLDTFNNARLAYQFFVNPLGVQTDSIENELTGQESDAWDGIWYSRGKLTESGYQVEIELPLRLFNFDDSKPMQEWGIELVRFYPRNEVHRLSTQVIDRNIACQLCQMGVATGLSGIARGHDIQITPSLVATGHRDRQLAPTREWQNDTNVEPSLDVRWGITPSTVLNATINPDFSQVEADAGQLDVNSTFALFYDEKRAFFLDNKDYFDTQLNLIHTRNIVSPDYGVKLSSKSDAHTFAMLATNDTQTNFLVPGNLSSDIAVIDEESYNLAARYRYDLSNVFSIGGLITNKTGEHYQNSVASSDIKYQPTNQDTLTAQLAYSQTDYPDDLYRQFCHGSDEQCASLPTECTLNDCSINERVIRTYGEDSLSDSMYRLKYEHNRRNWQAFAQYESTGEDFRADLGFVEKVDISKAVVGGGYIWYPKDSSFNKIRLAGDWDITHNQNGELIEREVEAFIELTGAMQSYAAIGGADRERVGRRHDGASLAIDGNTQRFDETVWWFYGEFVPWKPIKAALDLSWGDDIDFSNDKPATSVTLNPDIEWKITDSLSANVSHTYRHLDIDDGRLFTANLSDIRINWQLSIESFIRFTSVYTHIERDPNLYLYSNPDSTVSQLGNELLYGYQLNPQSVFYLGYSDAMRADSDIQTLKTNEQTVFVKVSYAWLL